MHPSLAPLAALLLLAAGPLASPAPPAPREPRHVALLVGIADYVHFTPDGEPGKTDLNGSENDVDRMRASLRRWGFTDTTDVRVLKSRQATRAAIAEGFAWLATRATDTSDVVVVYYSGHGSNAPDGADRDEPDGRDEGLVPADARDIHAPGQLVLDDQIRGWLARLATKNVTVIVDACYSGTITRGAGDAPGRAKGPMPAPATGAGSGGARTGGDMVEAEGHTLITAASSNETALELPYPTGEGAGQQDVWFGVLTYNLTRAMDGAATERGAHYDEVMERVAAEMRGQRAPHTPQLEGDRRALLFRSNTGVAARPFAVVAGRAGAGRVSLDVGAVNGVRRGAIYDVFGAGELRFDGAPVAQLRVDSVTATRAVGPTVDAAGQPMPAAAARVTAGARAVPSLVPLGARRVEQITVYLDRTADSLRAAVAALGYAVPGDSAAASAHVTARRGAIQVLYRGTALPPLATDSTRPLPAVQRLPATQGYRDASQLAGPLSRALAISALEAIENPAPPADLSVHVRAMPAGSRAPADTLGPGIDTVRVGRSYDIWVRVGVPPELAPQSTLYMSAAVEGYTSCPAVLWPESAAPRPAELNAWTRIAQAVPIEEPTGSEVLRVLVSSDQYTLHSLVGALPACGARSAAGTRGFGAARVPPKVTGWQSFARRMEIVR